MGMGGMGMGMPLMAGAGAGLLMGGMLGGECRVTKSCITVSSNS